MLAAAFAMATTAQTLPAQFTTVVVPPPKEQRPTVPRSMLSDSSRDTSTTKRLAEMSAWVDSAAVAMGIEPVAAESLAATVPADTTGAPLAGPPADTTAGPPADTTGGPPTDSLAAPPTAPAGPDEFREGAPAPDTATLFPMLGLLGAALIGAGTLLRRK
jgi:hypothetical protein